MLRRVRRAVDAAGLRTPSASSTLRSAPDARHCASVSQARCRALTETTRLDRLRQQSPASRDAGASEDCASSSASRQSAARLRRRWTTTSSTTVPRQLLAIGYNVDEHRARRRASTICWLRKRGWRSFVAIAQGKLAAGALVRAGAPAHRDRRRAGAAVLERLDVRVPDAAAGDADVRGHAARPDLQGGSVRRQIEYGASAACRGAFRSPATTRSTRS